MRNRFAGLRWPVAALMLSFAAVLSAESPDAGKGAVGADVTVFELPSVQRWTDQAPSPGTQGYSVGTTSCNVGDAPLKWCNVIGGCAGGMTAAEHPVIAQNMYRLKNGRMDQIGASWLKHGFTSLNNSASGCGDGSCEGPPHGSRQLGVGCTDPYGAGLNGSRPLGRKSEVNASSGVFPYPFGQGGSQTASQHQRLAVAEVDMAAASNPGARFFVEGQYVAPDDAAAGNGLNNASYREVTVNASTFGLTTTGSTIRQKSAIEAWPVIDPTVELLNVDVPSVPVERFHVARKVTLVSPGLWHYEYAVHNLNSDRSADRLSVRFFGATTFSGVGFHDVNAHSGEPYDGTDWSSTLTTDSVQWQAPAFTPPKDGNAIRWGTMYNFWFDATSPPEEIASHTLGLFQTGTPSELVFLEGDIALFANGFED